MGIFTPFASIVNGCAQSAFCDRRCTGRAVVAGAVARRAPAVASGAAAVRRGGSASGVGIVERRRPASGARSPATPARERARAQALRPTSAGDGVVRGHRREAGPATLAAAARSRRAVNAVAVTFGRFDPPHTIVEEDQDEPRDRDAAANRDEAGEAAPAAARAIVGRRWSSVVGPGVGAFGGHALTRAPDDPRGGSTGGAGSAAVVVVEIELRAATEHARALLRPPRAARRPSA